MKRQNESQLQIACVRWFRAQYPYLAALLYHPRNEAHEYSRRIAIDAAEGVVPGVADLVLALPGAFNGKLTHSLGIELKYGRNKQSEAQKNFQRFYTAAGSAYAVVYSLDEFINTIQKYLDMTPRALLVQVKKVYNDIEHEELEAAKARFQKLLNKNE